MSRYKKMSTYVNDADSDAVAAPRISRGEFKPSPALLSLARLGKSGIRTRQVAILVGSGVEEQTTKAIYIDLLADGAMPHYVGSQRGKIKTSGGGELDVEMSLDADASVLYDAVVIADGESAAQQLSKDPNAMDFIRQQYRLCTPFLVIGAGGRLLTKAYIPATLPSGMADPAISFVAEEGQLQKAIAAFKRTLATD